MLKTALTVIAVIGACATMKETVVLRATFEPAAGASVEYGQGAIERCEALHRPLSDVEWVIADDEMRNPDDWQRRLNEAVGDRGSFRVVVADDELRRRVLSGEIQLQR